MIDCTEDWVKCEQDWPTNQDKRDQSHNGKPHNPQYPKQEQATASTHRGKDGGLESQLQETTLLEALKHEVEYITNLRMNDGNLKSPSPFNNLNQSALAKPAGHFTPGQWVSEKPPLPQADWFKSNERRARVGRALRFWSHCTQLFILCPQS